jgi:hypothetical protein
MRRAGSSDVQEGAQQGTITHTREAGDNNVQEGAGSSVVREGRVRGCAVGQAACVGSFEPDTCVFILIWSTKCTVWCHLIKG